MRSIDLNADLGEGFGRYRLGDDAALLDVVTSCNVACGFHAGDPETMRRTVRTAVAKGVAIGAHPSWPDRQGFGRREMHLDPHELHALVLYQLGALAGLVREAARGVALHHVKAHGALYHQLSASPALADAFVDAARAFDPQLVVVAQSGSAFAQRARAVGCRVAQEAFVDRGYAADGRLAPRGMPGAVLESDAARVAQAVALACHGRVTVTGAAARDIALDVDTLCIHGDSPGAVATAAAVRRALEAAGVGVVALSV